jgi:hypothetical protein
VHRPVGELALAHLHVDRVDERDGADGLKGFCHPTMVSSTPSLIWATVPLQTSAT